MDQSAISQLNMFLEDMGFPTDKESLLLESMEAQLPQGVRDAIALLPEGDYMTREDVRRELIGMPDRQEKHDEHHDDAEDSFADGKTEELPDDAFIVDDEEGK